MEQAFPTCVLMQMSLSMQFLQLWLRAGTPMQTMCNVNS